MKFTPLAQSHSRRPAWSVWALAAAASLALLSACGGGGDTPLASSNGALTPSPVANNGTSTGAITDTSVGSTSPVTSVPPVTAATAYTDGTVTGFGSVIVNGVRFDDSSVSLIDDDGFTTKGSGRLKLGMQVQITSDRVAGGKAKAHHMRFGSPLLGPVQTAYDATSKTLVVLGQTVDVTDTTVVESDGVGSGTSVIASAAQALAVAASDLSTAAAVDVTTLAAGNVVDVHGQWDTTTGHLVATRIELKTIAPTAYKLQGTVKNLNAVAHTFNLGAALIDYNAVSAAAPFAALANDQTVRVKLGTTFDATKGAWTVLAASTGTPVSTKAPVNVEAHIHGSITAFTSATAFTVGTTVVDASTAAFPNGSAGVVLGAAVRVEGTVNASGVLVATKVELEGAAKSGGLVAGNTIIGSVYLVDTVNKLLVVQNASDATRLNLITYTAATTFTGGTEAALVKGATVTVTGTVFGGRGKKGHRGQVQATDIKFSAAAI